MKVYRHVRIKTGRKKRDIYILQDEDLLAASRKVSTALNARFPQRQISEISTSIHACLDMTLDPAHRNKHFYVHPPNYIEPFELNFKHIPEEQKIEARRLALPESRIKIIESDVLNRLPKDVADLYRAFVREKDRLVFPLVYTTDIVDCFHSIDFNNDHLKEIYKKITNFTEERSYPLEACFIKQDDGKPLVPQGYPSSPAIANVTLTLALDVYANKIVQIFRKLYDARTVYFRYFDNIHLITLDDVETYPFERLKNYITSRLIMLGFKFREWKPKSTAVGFTPFGLMAPEILLRFNARKRKTKAQIRGEASFIYSTLHRAMTVKWDDVYNAYTKNGGGAR